MTQARIRAVAVVASLASYTLLAVVPFRAAPAQQTDTVADALIGAVLRYTFRHDGGNAQLLRGRVPDDLAPNFHVPSGTRVLGSVVVGSGVLVLATSTFPRDSLREEYARALGPKGWRPMESVARMGGFVDMNPQMPLTLCRQGAQLHVTSLRRSPTTSDLFLLYRDGSGPCDESSRVVLRRMSEPAPFPTLFSPATPVELRGRCSAGQPGHGGLTATATRLPTEMSAEELLRHYARHIEEQGWRPATSDGHPLVRRMWTRTDSTRRRELHLQVQEMGIRGVRCYDVRMDISDGTW